MSGCGAPEPGRAGGEGRKAEVRPSRSKGLGPVKTEWLVSCRCWQSGAGVKRFVDGHDRRRIRACRTAPLTGAVNRLETLSVAIILRGRTPCAICGSALERDDDIVATSHFISDPADPLWQFSDAGMHRSCFLAWDLRATFVERFNVSASKIVFANGTSHQMAEDGTIASVQRR